MFPGPAITLSQKQRGVIARFQLRRNAKDHVIDDLIRGGRLERIERGVFRVAGGAALEEQPAFAAALRARPSATITGPVALGLLGVPGFCTSDPFEILTAPDRRLTGVRFTHRRDPDPARAVTKYGEVRVAEPIDALIDAAVHVDRFDERALRVAWDHLRWHLDAKPDRLDGRLERLNGEVPGAAILARVLEKTGGVRIDGEGERGLWPILSCFEPAFEPQVWVTPGRRVDFFSHRCRYAYEYLGEVDHGHVAERLADDARDTELREEGIRIGYVTKDDLREPRVLLATIAGTLTVRAHELGVEPPVAVRPLPTDA